MSDTATEPAGAGYEVCTSLISALSQMLDKCETTTNPWEARYRYDAILPFVITMDEQIDTLDDDSERDTCREQYQQMIEKGRRIAPSIPLICALCGDAYAPDGKRLQRSKGEADICPPCRAENNDVSIEGEIPAETE